MGGLEPSDSRIRGMRELLYNRDGWVGRITLNRPQAYNAYSTSSLQEAAAAFQRASRLAAAAHAPHAPALRRLHRRAFSH